MEWSRVEAVESYQIRIERLFFGPLVTALQFSSPKSMSDVEGTGIESSVLMFAEIVSIFLVTARVAALKMSFDGQSFGIESAAFAASSNLFVDIVEGLRDVKSGADSDRGSVQMTRTDFGNMAHAVHLLIFVRVLIVEIGFQRQFCAAGETFETSLVEEGEIL